MPIDNPYHEGELAVQQRANESDIARINGRAIDETILGGALRFIEQQAMVVIGSVNEKGQVWASVLFGNPGFLHAPDNRTVELDISQQRSYTQDPLWKNLQRNPNVGLIVIELGSRRRIRINGVAQKISDDKFIVNVKHAYPNCPKYIQRRVLKIKTTEKNVQNKTVKQGARLTTTQQQLITSADTFFVASAHPEQGVDASHRGGHPGFIKLINDRLLQIPDFVGNSLFNTLGNFASNPHAGLVYIDFDNNRVLQLTGTPEILWDMDDPTGETGGTKRFWQLYIDAWQESPLPVYVDWEYMVASPHIPEVLSDVKDKNKLQLKVDRIRQESDNVKSFRLRNDDNSLLPEFTAGAHLKVKVGLPDGNQADRHYSILNIPRERNFYEIGILKDSAGRGGSLYMHEHVNEGDILEIYTPKNEFPMSRSAEHSILIAGGIGITPILSMMHSLVESKQSFELHYTARSRSALVFRDRIETVADNEAHFYTSKDTDSQKLDLSKILGIPKQNVHVYVCGPVRLINAVRKITAENGWHASQVHFESFGAQLSSDDRSIEVRLTRSDKVLNIPANQSILDTLLDAGVEVPHDCKRGECSMCITRVTEGYPDHRDLCLSADERESSMCVCVSRAKSDSLSLDL